MSPSRPLNVLYVTPECAPWAKTGGLGDVSAALPRALCELGHDVRILMPAYRPLRPLLGGARARHAWPAEGPWPAAELVEVDADGLRLLLLDCPGFYDRLGSPYGDPSGRDFEDSLRRFAFLSWVASRLAAGHAPAVVGDWKVDVLHANDWPTALAVAYLRDAATTAATLFTIHNLAFQGIFPADRADWLPLPPHCLTVDGLMHWGDLCLMKAGLQFADLVTTVSPRYAAEIQTEAYGCGLDGLLRARAADLHGVVNGVDGAWNPERDPMIPQRYGPATLGLKALNKSRLLQRLGLPPGSGMLFGVVSRLTAQKGIDLVLDNVDSLVRNGHQLVVLGKGDAGMEAALQAAAARHPDHVRVVLGFDESLAHWIEAGADAFLMPSRFEPCGLNQMYSQAYGTPPIVRATGGLADTVDDAAHDGSRGTGFCFDEPTGWALGQVIDRAERLWRSEGAWNAVQQRGMVRDFSWAASAHRHADLYRQAVARRAPAEAPLASPPSSNDGRP